MTSRLDIGQFFAELLFMIICKVVRKSKKKRKAYYNYQPGRIVMKIF